MIEKNTSSTQSSSRHYHTGLVLLHNDLRLHDNATLQLAVTSCDYLLVVYAQGLAQACLSKKRGQAYEVQSLSVHRQRFLLESLADLNTKLTERGNALLYLTDQHLTNQQNHTNTHQHHEKPNQNTITDFDDITVLHQLDTLIRTQKVNAVFTSNTADYDQNQAYERIQQLHPTLAWHQRTTMTLFDALPTQALTQGKLPKIFSQFRKKIEYQHHLLYLSSDILLTPTPKTLPPLPSTLTADSALLFDNHTQPLTVQSQTLSVSPFLGGESHALAHLDNYFSSSAPASYKQTRNSLDTWEHSTKFSPWLANGTLSVRLLLNRLRDYEQTHTANDSTYWIFFELLWREYFYWYAKQHGNKLFWFKGIQHKKLLTSYYSERFERWKNGSTPFPIVNACMKQLAATGYMSNRGRQLVASCFVHELGLDWRYGASYFEQQLIDYDVASNWGNWQYLAGVGADPRGSRQFNLAKQTKTYDPAGEFITHWQGEVDASTLDSMDTIGADGYPTAYR